MESTLSQAADRLELTVSGLTHYHDRASRAGGITLCGLPHAVSGDPDAPFRGVCMHCRDAARRIDKELRHGTS